MTPAIIKGNTSSGLIGLSEFGTPELLLAQKVTHDDSCKSFTFTLKDDPNLVWVDSSGEPYIKDGAYLKVKPSDFRYGFIRTIEKENYTFNNFVYRSVEYAQ